MLSFLRLSADYRPGIEPRNRLLYFVLVRILNRGPLAVLTTPQRDGMRIYGRSIGIILLVRAGCIPPP
jgi:hypothetical protein